MARHNSTNVRHIRLFSAGYLGVFLLAQLFAFDAFPQLIQSATGMSTGWAAAVAIILVAAELMALPFLLTMDISRTLSRVSQASGFVALGILTILEVMALSGEYTMLFGAVLHLPSGAWSLLLLLAVWVLTIWGSVGTVTPVKKKPRGRSGFTIVELLVIIVVIVILVSIVLVVYSGVQRQARNTARLAELKQWVKIFDLYRVKNNKLPREGMPEVMLCLGRGFPELSDGKRHCRELKAQPSDWFTATEEDSAELMEMLEQVSEFPPSEKKPAGGGLVGPWAEFRNTPGLGRQVLLSTAIDSIDPKDCTDAGFISSYIDGGTKVQICTSQNLYDV